MKTDEKNWQSIVIAEKEKRDRESVGNEKMYNAIETAMNLYIPKLKPFIPTDESNPYIAMDKLVSKVIRLLDDDDITLIEVRDAIYAYVNIHSDLLSVVRSGDITTTVLHPHDISGINFRKALQPVVLHQLDYIDFQLGRLGDFDGDTW